MDDTDCCHKLWIVVNCNLDKYFSSNWTNKMKLRVQMLTIFLQVKEANRCQSVKLQKTPKNNDFIIKCDVDRPPILMYASPDHFWKNKENTFYI